MARRRRVGSAVTAQPGGDWERGVRLFLQEQRLMRRRERTLELHRETLRAARRDLDAAGAPDEPAALRREHLSEMVLGLQKRGRSPRTINLRLQSLRHLFGFLLQRGIVTDVNGHFRSTDRVVADPRQKIRG